MSLPQKKPKAIAQLTLQMPPDADIQVIARTLKLTEPQRDQLQITLMHIVADLEAYHKASEQMGERSELVRRFRAFAKTLQKFEDEIGRSKKLMEKFLPLDTQEALGVLLSYSAMEEALASEIITRKLDWSPASLTRSADTMQISEIENYFDYEKKTYGLKNAPELLEHFIKTVNRPIKKWHQLDRANKGGKKRDFLRWFVIHSLALNAREIIGKDATPTRKGAFSCLCSQVFIIYRLPDSGLEEAIERSLTELRAAPPLKPL